MFGAAGRVANTEKGKRYVVTEGTANYLGTDYYGYNDGTNGVAGVGDFGSIVPTTLEGLNIVTCHYFDFSSPKAFYFPLGGGDYTSTPEAYFTEITPQDGSSLLVASRTGVQHNVARNYTFWWWNGVTIPARWEGTGTSWVNIK